MELSGKRNDLPVYRLPTRLLSFNIRNGRFKAELLDKERKLGRKIETDDDDDADIIKILLLTINPKETDELKKSLIDLGQMHPGIITEDGAVINGNRRMAVLQSLYDQYKLPKYQFIEVGRLPHNVEDKDLWRIEAGIQLSKEENLEYSPINERLKLREGRDSAKLGSDEMSKALLGRFSKDEIEARLKELSNGRLS